MQSKSAISVVIAALNEDEGIGPTLAELKEVLADPCFIVVDGNSTDKTVKIAKNMGACIVPQIGKGKGNALHEGIKQLGSCVRYVVFIDADYTYPAKYVPKMIEVLEQHPEVGMVIGKRFYSEQSFPRSYTSPFYVGNRLLAHAQHVFNGIKLEDPLSGLRVVRCGILRGWNPKSKGFDVEAEMNFHVENKGFKIVEIPIEYRDRLGKKKLGLRHGFTIFLRILLESFNIDIGRRD
jgi:glycosyltransferase involved in cell wall biosynthesis